MREHPDPRHGTDFGPPRRLKDGYFTRWKTSNGIGTLLGVASFHRATCHRRNLSTIQAARREIAPHRAALIASLDKRFACRAFNLASFTGSCGNYTQNIVGSGQSRYKTQVVFP